MAAGDTIAGKIRMVREKATGDRLVVLGNLSTNVVDHKADPENALYVNPVPGVSDAPFGAGRSISAPGAVFNDSETMEIQHKSSSLEEAADYDADEVFISILEQDLNTGEVIPSELNASDTTLSANPTTSTSSWVTFFEYTVPSRKRVFVSGQFNIAPVENA